MNPRLKRYGKVVLFALLGLGILWYITRAQDVTRIWEEMKRAKFIWVFLSIVAGIISHLLRALRWNLLIRSMGQPARLSTTFHALMTGYLANLAVPRMGEVTRCATLSRYSGAPFNQLAGTVVAERFIDMLSLLLLIFLTIVFQFAFLKEFLDYYIFNPFLSLVFGHMWLVAVLGLGAMGGLWAAWLYFKKVSEEKTGFAARLKRQVKGFWVGMMSLAQVKNKVIFLVYTIFIWLFYFLTVYLVFFALEATSVLGVKDGFTLLALGSLGIVAPVPGGVGTYHFIVITTLTELFGLAPEPSTSYAYIAHAAQIIMILFVGGFSWFMLSLSVKKKEAMQEDEGLNKTENIHTNAV